MDVYISEEYVAQRRAERRAARIAAAAASRSTGGGEEKAARAADGEQKRRAAAAAWAENKLGKRHVDGGGRSANVGGGAAWLVGHDDAVLSYLSA